MNTNDNLIKSEKKTIYDENLDYLFKKNVAESASFNPKELSVLNQTYQPLMFIEYKSPIEDTK